MAGHTVSSRVRTIDLLINISWQFYLLSEFLPEISWEEITEKIIFVFYFDVWCGTRTLAVLSHYLIDYSDYGLIQQFCLFMTNLSKTIPHRWWLFLENQDQLPTVPFSGHTGRTGCIIDRCRLQRGGRYQSSTVQSFCWNIWEILSIKSESKAYVCLKYVVVPTFPCSYVAQFHCCTRSCCVLKKIFFNLRKQFS